jgi:beta-1,4-mannosyltransferase
MHVALVVLGDLGRSPRMINHALAFAESGAQVDLVGLAGAECPSAVARHPRIRLRRLPDAALVQRVPPSGASFLAASGIRLLHQAWTLTRALRGATDLRLVVVQSPPAVPALLVATAVARLRGARLVVDWHNLGHAVLALKLGPRHPAVVVLRFLERRLGRLADGHLCVSEALGEHLSREYGLRGIVVLHDRPTGRFLHAARGDRSAGQKRIRRELALSEGGWIIGVCPTSWTWDEDFDLLLEALEHWDTLTAGEPGRGNLCVVITGNGALRQSFEERIVTRTWKRARLLTRWIAPDDYPAFLASADIGLCFHTSASGLDLPMKIAEMRGAGLPVFAYRYAPCIGEQIENGRTGVLFRDAAELARHLHALLGPDGEEGSGLRALRGSANAIESWEEAWERLAPWGRDAA